MSTGSILESTYSPFHRRCILFRLEELREVHAGFFHTLFLVHRSLRSIYRRLLLGQAQLLK